MKINLVLVGIILTFGLVSGEGFQRMILNSVTIDLLPNPYLNSADVKISGKYNDTLTIKMPLLKEIIPNAIILNSYILYNGEEIPPMKGELCELFNDKMFTPDVLAAGVPEDKFPKQCPIPPNDDYAILNYKFSMEKLPPGFPDGTIVNNIYVSCTGDDNDYFMAIHAESLLKTDLPETPSLMG